MVILDLCGTPVNLAEPSLLRFTWQSQYQVNQADNHVGFKLIRQSQIQVELDENHPG